MIARALTFLQAGEALLDLAGARPPQCGTTRILAVDGSSGAGKTTFATALAERVHERTSEHPFVLHMDDIYPGWDGLNDSIPSLVRWVLEPLANGELAAYHRYDWANDRYAEWVPIIASDWLVIEGTGAAARACAPFLTAAMWVEADVDIRARRTLARDGEAFRDQWRRWGAQERSHFAVERTRARADIRLDTTRMTLDGGGPSTKAFPRH